MDRFENLVLIESQEEKNSFDAQTINGFPWAFPLQCYLELMCGDKRDKETAVQVLVDGRRSAMSELQSLRTGLLELFEVLALLKFWTGKNVLALHRVCNDRTCEAQPKRTWLQSD